MVSVLSSKIGQQFLPIDFRRLRVTIEFDTGSVSFEDLAITFTGTKFANIMRGEAQITIANITKDKSDLIVTEVTPFQRLRIIQEQGGFQFRRIIVEAGRESTGLTLVYIGDITFATITQPPDVLLTITAKTGLQSTGNIVSRNQPLMSNLSKIAESIANDLELTLNFEATDKQIANYSFTGAALKQIDKLEEMGNIDVFIDDNVLNVKNRNEPLANRVRLLNPNNGLIGIPRGSERGVSVTTLFDENTVIGGALQLESEKYPGSNGRYEIYKIDYNLTNRDVPFYQTLDCQRING